MITPENKKGAAHACSNVRHTPPAHQQRCAPRLAGMMRCLRALGSFDRGAGRQRGSTAAPALDRDTRPVEPRPHTRGKGVEPRAVRVRAKRGCPSRTGDDETIQEDADTLGATCFLLITRHERSNPRLRQTSQRVVHVPPRGVTMPRAFCATGAALSRATCDAKNCRKALAPPGLISGCRA